MPMPKDSNTKLFIATAAKELASAKATLAVMHTEMACLTQQIPECEPVCAMYGVGEKTAPQLMTEFGDVRRFLHRSFIVRSTGIDVGLCLGTGSG